jgi:SAM-dependent methyltransferase
MSGNETVTDVTDVPTQTEEIRRYPMDEQSRRYPMDEQSEQIDPTFGERVNAALYDPFLWLGERRGMRRHRGELLAGARGRVLEIGAGTGLNVEHYPAAVDELVLAEPDAGMAARIDTSEAPVPASVVVAPAEELPFEDASFDAVVSTLVLCTVEDPDRALAEIGRVLRPDGRLLFVEHVRAESPRLARWQERLATPWEIWANGCRCDRPTLERIEERFAVRRVERETWRGMPAIVHPLVIGEAAVA